MYPRGLRENEVEDVASWSLGLVQGTFSGSGVIDAFELDETHFSAY